ncbi:uncharacterized protein LOC111625459 isoform X2 [Centruroides sculpturatus]|uniref:uncharacterized protein LOC111625459 isoform X2 n=1 Tax=Centruroides sculpturatus TaxID=218467 RepID=UPI000C6D94E3|nr:uncharacterized protein LOC111625459 isoform X2 [Centruroides sculpturatus]
MKFPSNSAGKKKEDACPYVTDRKTKSDRANKTTATQTSSICYCRKCGGQNENKAGKKRKLSLEVVNCNPPSKKQKLMGKHPCKVPNKKRKYKKKTTVAQKKRSSVKRTNRRKNKNNLKKLRITSNNKRNIRRNQVKPKKSLRRMCQKHWAKSKNCIPPSSSPSILQNPSLRRELCRKIFKAVLIAAVCMIL